MSLQADAQTINSWQKIMDRRQKRSVVFGVGTDIESIDRFNGLDRSDDHVFLNKVYTRDELEYCFSHNIAGAHLAVRYAGKEAVVKALSKFDAGYISYHEIEILRDSKGAPRVKLNKKGFDAMTVDLSLSHCDDRAIAFALVTEVGIREED